MDTVRTTARHVVKVKRETLEACMTCPLCNSLLREATTISLCLHTCKLLYFISCFCCIVDGFDLGICWFFYTGDCLLFSQHSWAVLLLCVCVCVFMFVHSLEILIICVDVCWICCPFKLWFSSNSISGCSFFRNFVNWVLLTLDVSFRISRWSSS